MILHIMNYENVKDNDAHDAWYKIYNDTIDYTL